MAFQRLLILSLLIPLALATIILEDYDSADYSNTDKSPVSSIEVPLMMSNPVWNWISKGHQIYHLIQRRNN